MKMKLKNTVKMMNSEDYVERFRGEYFQLKIRIDGLRNMLDKMKDGTLSFKPRCDYDILHRQLVYMENYRMSLKTRAIIEEIDLSF